MVSIGNIIERFEVTTSTNSLLKARAELGLAKEGTVVWADHQTAGRGRMERVWEADPGKGLLFSTLLMPNSSFKRITLIGLLASMAVYDSILEQLAQIDSFDQSRAKLLRLKWPNDILFDGRKLCGILCESGIDSDSKNRFIVIGIGVNVNQKDEDFSSEIQHLATSLYQITGELLDREQLLNLTLKHLNRYVDKVRQFGDDWVVAEWLKNSAIMGNRVKVSQRDQVLEGICQGLEVDGAMKLKLYSGETIKVYSGDSSL